jgi:hypothetical protein
VRTIAATVICLVVGLLIATAFWLGATAFAALITAVFTGTLFLNAHHQLLHNRQVERAYVKISHPSPGIRQLDPSGNIWLEVSIKNYGKTPARVTDVVIKPVVIPHDDQLPTVPDYTVQFEGPKPKAFLVADDEFFLSRFYKITPDERSKVVNLQSDLYMIGYVDYTDQFDQRHRGGYARQYFPMIDAKSRYETDEEFDQQKFDRRNNLLVVAQEGYNYDQVRA